MSDLKLAYGTVSQAITCSLAPSGTGLVNAGMRESTAIDNSSNLFADILLYLAIKLATGTPGNEKCIKIYFYGSEDGTNFTDNATGSDASIVPRAPTNLLGPFLIQTPASGALTYKAVFPIAQFFGGIIPPKWGIAIYNATNLSFDATEASHTKEYRGIYQTAS